MKIRTRLPAGILAMLAAAVMVPGPALSAVRVEGLRCHRLADPLGIDEGRPMLSWRLASEERGQRQAAYRVWVAEDEAALAAGEGLWWDSGRVESDETVGIAYGGRELESRRRLCWKVRVWDQDGNPADSDVATWEMGLLAPSDWRAEWIGRTEDVAVEPAPLLRKEFVVDGAVKRARAYIAGLGYFELSLNGRRVGDHLLDPGYTRYDRRVLYVTHDVTGLLREGANAAGVMLGHGWYNVSNKAAWDFDQAPWRAAPKVLCQIEVEYADGRREVIGTDETWATADSPIRYTSIYSGETYDARREQPGWDEAAFDASGWDAALKVTPPAGTLSAQMMPPIRADRELAPATITAPAQGIHVVDFGQALSGHVRLRVSGPAGTKVVMKYGERLDGNGRLDQGAIATHVVRYGADQAFQTDTYILKGEGAETWHARFTYHGFQYVEITGWPGELTPDALRAVFLHSDVPPIGTFACSNPLLNKIAEAARWSYLGNLHGIPTDCPHREKNGWTGDAHLAAEQALFTYDPSAVYAKWIQDLADEQRPDGRLPGIVPTGGWGYQWGNGPAWDSALLLIPYYQYLYRGDAELLRRHYDSMKRYVDSLTGRADERGVVSIGLNDWAPYETTTEAGITDTAYYSVDTKIVALAAELLGKDDEATQYRALAERIARDFHAAFYRPDTGLYDNGSQTALSCALYQGLVPPEFHDRVLGNLLAAVDRTNGHIDTGILGAKYLLHALTQGGRADVAYRIASQKDLPSWGWWIEQGATTLWEQWKGGDSRYHIMYGDIVAWFYQALAGIRPDPKAPGFKHVLIRPEVVGDLTAARADVDSVRGPIVSDWRLADGTFHIRVAIPANATATLRLPVDPASPLRERRQPAATAPGVLAIRPDGTHTIVEIASGEYQFTGAFRPPPTSP